jgi:hypothetical protein
MYIYEVANHLSSKISDDNLAKIIANGGKDNQKFFKK